MVKPDLNQIANDQEQVRLEPRTMDVLVYLARHNNLVISREELLDKVWCDSFVAENTLSRTISRLRKALGDNWQHPRYVETISKTGYRWISPVHSIQPPDTLKAADEDEEIVVHQSAAHGWRPLITAITLVILVAILAGWWQPWRPEVPEAPLTEIRPAVTLIGRQANPALSPDGRHIAFAWQGAEAQNWDIYVHPVDADNPRRLTDGPHPEVLPAWSPDGQFLAFISGTDACGIYQIPLIGGARVKLADCLYSPRHLVWSPDGTRLAFDGRATPDGLQGIFMVAVNGGPPTPILHPDPETQGDWYPVFSPDHTRVAFLRRQSADLHHIYTHDLRHGTLQRITTHQAGRIRGLDWTADSRSLVYSYNHDGRFALWKIGLDGEPPRRLPITDAWVTYPSLARSSDTLIYKNYVDVVDLWNLELDALGAVLGEPKRIVPSTRSELHPRLSPTGHDLAFLSNRTGAFEVWSGSNDKLIRHSNLDGLVPGLVDWGPAGRRLVFDARRNGQSDLFLVDVESRAPHALTQTDSNEVNPRFGPDGATLYYGCDWSGEWQIWAMDLNRKSHRQITRLGGYFAQADPEGNALWFTRLNQPGIFELELATGEERELWKGIGLADWGNWQVCKTGIYFLDRSTNSLMFAPPEGESRVVYRGNRTFPYLGPSFHVAPDERRIVFGEITQSDDEIMIATIR